MKKIDIDVFNKFKFFYKYKILDVIHKKVQIQFCNFYDNFDAYFSNIIIIIILYNIYIL